MCKFGRVEVISGVRLTPEDLKEVYSSKESKKKDLKPLKDHFDFTLLSTVKSTKKSKKKS